MKKFYKGLLKLFSMGFFRFYPAVLFCLVFCLLFFGAAIAEEKPIGKVIGIIGTVEFLSGTRIPVAEAKPGVVRTVAFEKWEIIKFHQPIYPKDQFRTLRKSRVKILFEDNSLIAMGPNSTFKVESYIYNSKDKLRQGVLNLSHGLGMYIVNKSQKNKDSFFRIVTPTANIAARGTQGFVSAAIAMTFVANQAGDVDTENVEPEVCREMQIVGAGEGNKIPKDGCPTTPAKLTKNQFNQIKNIILGTITTASTGGTGSDGKPLITVEGGGVNDGGAEGGGAEGGSAEGGSADGFGGDFLTSVEPIAELFAEVNEPFNTSQLDSCTP